MSSLNWGLLGTARITRKIIPAMRQAERNQVLAVASRDAQRAEAFAAEWSIPRSYAGYEALLDDPEVQAVYIPLPNSLHAEWTVRCAEAGKHILCEKPIALSLEELERMQRACAAAGVQLMEAIMVRYHPQSDQVQRLVAAGELGRLVQINFSFSISIVDEDNIRLDPALGGGCLWDLGCYAVNFARFVLSEEPEQAMGYQVLGLQGADEQFNGLLRFPSGAMLQFDCSFRAPRRVRAEVVGQAASLVLTHPVRPHEGGELRLRREGEERRWSASSADPWQRQIEHFSQRVLDGAPAKVPFEDSLGNTRAIGALYESARSGHPVSL